MKKLELLDKYFLMLFGLFLCLFIFLSVKTHFGLKTQADDLGNISQALWNSTQGRLMEYSNFDRSDIVSISRFAGHANIIYLFFVPVYWLFTDPTTLLVLQVLFATAGAIPLYLLGKHYFTKKKQQWLALVGPVVYFLNPMLHDAILYDIHAIVLGLPFLTGALYGLLTKKNRVFVVSAILLALCKEDMPLLIFMMGLYAIFIQKRKKFGLIVSGVALAYFVFLLQVFMPAFSSELQESETLISKRYEDLGGSPTAMIKTALTNPSALFTVLQENQAGNYLFLHLLGFGFLPLLNPLSLVAAPSFAINLLSANPITSMPFGYYYAAPIVGVFSVSLVKVLRDWKKFKYNQGLSTKQVGVGVLVVSAIFSWWNSPVPFSRVSSLEEFKVDQSHLDYLSDLRALIGEDTSLSVQNNLGPHFIHRENIVRFPYRKFQSDYVLIDVTNPYPILRDKPRQRNFVHITQLYPQSYYDQVLEMFEHPEYGVVFAEDGFIVFKQGSAKDLNQKAFTMFQSRSQEIFAPLASVAPVEYRDLQIIDNRVE